MRSNRIALSLGFLVSTSTLVGCGGGGGGGAFDDDESGALDGGDEAGGGDDGGGNGDAITPPPDGCPPTQVLCGGACRDLASDPGHCGGCAIACAIGAKCASGGGGAGPSAKPAGWGAAGRVPETSSDHKNPGGG